MIQSSEFADDPLSDLLRLVDARPILSGGFSAGGDWALRFPAPAALKFFAIEKGQCWLKLENSEDVIRLREGDAVLLTKPQSFVMASDLSVAALDAVELFADKPDKTAVTVVCRPLLLPRIWTAMRSEPRNHVVLPDIDAGCVGAASRIA